ncbi:hypothetical protein ACFODO_16095 [Acinetobacter sichuanensis]|uniref:Uncharacterized protein n=1 Tax=Acinetobacter sichuanensis TaxID=2136183 RepID=A0A371YIQ7_9GAMM|nr:hypothetical protein [Acinetobacter sichuanensis]RFC81352.1 hypothetical protein C9E89_022345 [Acinetobacter sichuanensis]
MNAVADKFEQFEWLTHGITAKSPQFSDEAKGTGEKPLDYQDRLGAIASMETQLEKSVTSVIVFGEKSKGDFDFIVNHLARILVVNAKEDGKRDPKTIPMEDLGKKIGWMVLMYALFPDMERQHTAYGRLCFAGQLQNHMSEDAYRVSWKKYENLMIIALETSIKCAAEAVEKYRKNTYKELKA